MASTLAGREGYARAVTTTWASTTAGVLRLPSGRLVRGRGLRRPLPAGPVPPSRCICWATNRPVSWEAGGFTGPTSGCRPTAQQPPTHCEAWTRAKTERVEVACGSGYGRTGTALACLAVLDGIPNREAIAYVREQYAPRAVETPWQRRFVTLPVAARLISRDPKPPHPPGEPSVTALVAAVLQRMARHVEDRVVAEHRPGPVSSRSDASWVRTTTPSAGARTAGRRPGSPREYVLTFFRAAARGRGHQTGRRRRGGRCGGRLP